MKNILLTFSVLLYSLLFYNQSAGINFLLFNLLLIVFLAILNRKLLQDRGWVAVAAACIASSCAIALYSTTFALLANIISLCILSALSAHAYKSLITAFPAAILSGITSPFYLFISIREMNERKIETGKSGIIAKTLIFGVPTLIAILFFFIYRASNPLFYNYTKNLNLSFIPIGWILFTQGGVLLLYAFFHQRKQRGIAKYEDQLSETIEFSKERRGFLSKHLNIENECLSGVVLFILLNLVLLSLNILDICYLWFRQRLPDGMSFSESVHQGVGMLILSLIMAILIILFYFRGALNFHRDNKFLKILAYCWVAQNSLMIFSTMYRNQMYIGEYYLTYKRIGVYIYLLLAFIGLITTCIKIKKIKTNWFLFSTNAAVVYAVVILLPLFNWDSMITDFNIQHSQQQGRDVDKIYLAQLSPCNLPALLRLKAISSHYDYSFAYLTDYTLYRFMEASRSQSFPSFCLDTYNTRKALLDESLVKTVTDLSLPGSKVSDLSCLSPFRMLTRLDLQNNKVGNIRQLLAFPNLKVLDLRQNEIYVLKGIENLKELQELDISYNPVISYSPLSALKNLERLYVNDSIKTWELNSFRASLPHTHIILKN